MRNVSDLSSISHLKTEIREGVALVGLNRPQRANAYDQRLLQSLDQALEKLAHNPEVRALVLHGTESRHFCAGADRDELSRRLPEEALDLEARRVFENLARWPWPTVAAIRGAALGGGLELALACDVRLATRDALFGFPETALGLIPAAGGCLRAPRILGDSLAREMVLFGRQLSAEEALRCGLVSQVVPGGELLERARELAGRAAARHPLATRLAKQALGLSIPRGDVLEFEGSAQALLYGLPDSPFRSGQARA
ncbi:MAG: enoyl-CoA hydratase/isomerase family protein [Candidatus Xenobium sp.]|jgi:enoyl-CoA hydratase|nr:enoyl-CoA hydratase/isomerase family protein [Burkholderiales bacterium]